MPLRIFIFIAIEVLLYPVTLLGVVAYMLVIFVVNRRQGISGTAYEPFMGRLIIHDMESRPDPAAKELAAHLPASWPPIWLLMVGPTLLATRLSGYRPGMLTYPPERPAGLMSIMNLRTWFFDQSLTQALPEIAQLVILGAGWDTRAYDLPSGWTGRVFEVDAPATQRAKRKAAAAAELDMTRVTYVSVDFKETSWLAALEANGLDPALPTYVLWEGVTMYLDADAVGETFESFRKLGEGSLLAFDYLPAELIEARPPWARWGKVLPLAMKLTYGEPMGFGVPTQPEARSALSEFLTAHGLELEGFDQAGEPLLYGVALAKAHSSRPNESAGAV